MDRTEQLKSLVDSCRDLILKTERDIWAKPETGYHEWATNAYMEKIFEDLGYSLTKAGDIPGFYTDLDTGKPGPKVAILGELDSLICNPCRYCRCPKTAGRSGWHVRFHPFNGSSG